MNTLCIQLSLIARYAIINARPPGRTRTRIGGLAFQERVRPGGTDMYWREG